MKKLALAAILATLAALPLSADVYTSEKAHSEATFQVRHLLTNVSGKFKDFEAVIDLNPAKLTSSSVQFTIQAASVDTNDADRDKHLQSSDFFDVAKTPLITFKSSKIVATKTKGLYDVTGVLTMRGVSKVVTLPVQLVGFAKDPWGNEKAGFAVTTKVNRKDYGINWNKALDNGGALVGDIVTINVNLEAVKSKPKA